jgi:hypothetical protein
MKFNKEVMLSVIYVLLITTGVIMAELRQTGTLTPEYFVCTGKVEIIRVEITDKSRAQSTVLGGPGYEGYEVWFKFVPENEIRDERLEKVISKEHEFRLANSWYVGKRYLEKYGITPGKIYPCLLKILIRGTGTPVIFEIEGLDKKDYFESRR